MADTLPRDGGHALAEAEDRVQTVRRRDAGHANGHQAGGVVARPSA
jgi:hypothetical protein